MDKYLEKRFSYLNDLSLDELLKLREEIITEINYINSTINNKRENYLKRSEFSEDSRYERDKYRYIEELIAKKR